MNRRLQALHVHAVTAMLLFGCGGGGDTTTAPPVSSPAVVASVDISPVASHLEVGRALQLTATPRDAQGNVLAAAVSWSSSNQTLAVVSANGLVTALSAGAVSITATSSGKSASATITVVRVPVAGITVTLVAPSLTVGQNTVATAQLRDGAGLVLSDRSVTWSSSNASVATVSQSGGVVAAGAGQANIVATSEGISGSAAITVVAIQVSTVTVNLPTTNLTVGQSTNATAVIRDPNGMPIQGQAAVWSSSNATVATIAQSGQVAALTPGVATITATAGGKSAGVVVSVRAVNTQAVNAMFQALPAYITSARAYNEDLLPRNQHIASQIQAKIAVLQRATLSADIQNAGLFVAGSATSRDAREVPVVSIFMLDSMRSDAAQSIISVALTMPLLEEFFAVPFPASAIRLWYGFVMGNTGGGGSIFSEDRGTYEARTPPTRLPFEAILSHELGHSYIGHESLNQFLELYAFNMITTKSRDVPSWTYSRAYSPFAPTNSGVHALLDVYQLIGWQAMADAYRAIFPMRPPYGVELSAAVKQVFVDHAPATLKTRVAELVARIGF